MKHAKPKPTFESALKKLKAGKKLAQSEIALIQNQAARPRGENVFRTIKDASVAMNLPIAALQMFRAAGCPAFRTNGKVHRDELIQWMRENPQLIPRDAGSMVTKLEWDAKDKQAIAEMRQHRLAVLKRDVIGVGEVKLKFTRAILDAKKSFTEAVRTLVQEAMLHCGATETQIAWAMERGEKRTRDVLAKLAAGEFAGVTCPKCKTEIKL